MSATAKSALAGYSLQQGGGYPYFVGDAHCAIKRERTSPRQSRPRASADDSVRNMTLQPPLAHPSEPPAGRVFQGSPAPAQARMIQ